MICIYYVYVYQGPTTQHLLLCKYDYHSINDNITNC